MIPSPSTIDELKAKHAGIELHLLDFEIEGAEPGAIVVKRPPKSEWERLSAQLADDKTNGVKHTETFVRVCAVWPSPTELDKLFSAWPALVGKFSNELAVLAGTDARVRAKKL